MGKYLIALILLSLYLQTFSQLKFDTLFIGNKKIPLEKSKVFDSYGSRDIVALPSEYKNLDHDFSPKIKAFADSSYVVVGDGTGTLVGVMAPEPKTEPYKGSYYLPSFVDTIRLKFSDLESQKCIFYIKSHQKKIKFTSALIMANYNDTLTRHIIRGASNNIFSDLLWSYFKYPDESKIKKTSYILRDLYYRKGITTYHLDRQFIIIVY